MPDTVPTTLGEFTYYHSDGTLIGNNDTEVEIELGDSKFTFKNGQIINEQAV